jgi:hypothetical protein
MSLASTLRRAVLAAVVFATAGSAVVTGTAHARKATATPFVIGGTNAAQGQRGWCACRWAAGAHWSRRRSS